MIFKELTLSKTANKSFKDIYILQQERSQHSLHNAPGGTFFVKFQNPENG